MAIDKLSNIQLYSRIQELIDKKKGDYHRLEFIQNCLREGKPLYNSDKKYLEKILVSSPSPKIISIDSDRHLVLAALRQIIRWRLGDLGRLEYIYQTLQKRKPLYNSDKAYLKAKLESLSKHNVISYDDLETKIDIKNEPKPEQKCSKCQRKINLHDKVKRVNFFWYHENCYIPANKISLEKQAVKQQIRVKPITSKSNNNIQIKIKPDPILILLASTIFGLLFYTAYFMFTFLSIIAISVAAIMVFYHLISSKIYSREERKYGKKRMSIYSIFVLVLPFTFGAIMALDGFNNFMSIVQAIFVWMLTLSFWQTMLFVPLAIHSAQKEKLIKDPLVFPSMSVLIPAYNEEKVIQLTIESVLNAEYPDKEIIVIDDGSTDRTLAIAQRYKDRIKVLHKQNGGKASALNFGLVFAKGQIITIIDADTIIGRQSLKNIAKGFTDENIAAVAGNVKVRNKVNWLTWCQALEYLTGIQIMRRALDYFGAITIVPGALGAFRKKKLLESGAYDKSTIVEDFDATVKVLKSGLVVQSSSNAVAYTQAPQTLRDFYNQRKRWYRGNLQVMTHHSDALTNPRFGSLQRFAYPLMIIHMLLIPISSILVWGFAAYQLLVGQYVFVGFMVGMFVLLQYLLGLMAVRIDGDEKKLVLFSVFLVVGYKQLLDVLQLKAAIEELFRRKAIWTSAKRVRT